MKICKLKTGDERLAGCLKQWRKSSSFLRTCIFHIFHCYYRFPLERVYWCFILLLQNFTTALKYKQDIPMVKYLSRFYQWWNIYPDFTGYGLFYHFLLPLREKNKYRCSLGLNLSHNASLSACSKHAPQRHLLLSFHSQKLEGDVNKC